MNPSELGKPKFRVGDIVVLTGDNTFKANRGAMGQVTGYVHYDTMKGDYYMSVHWTGGPTNGQEDGVFMCDCFQRVYGQGTGEAVEAPVSEENGQQGEALPGQPVQSQGQSQGQQQQEADSETDSTTEDGSDSDDGSQTDQPSQPANDEDSEDDSDDSGDQKPEDNTQAESESEQEQDREDDEDEDDNEDDSDPTKCHYPSIEIFHDDLPKQITGKSKYIQILKSLVQAKGMLMVDVELFTQALTNTKTSLEFVEAVKGWVVLR